MKKTIILLIICTVLILPACSSSTKEDISNTERMESVEESYDTGYSNGSMEKITESQMEQPKTDSSSINDEVNNQNKIEPKIIRNVFYEIETLHFDDTIDNVKFELTSVNGYIEDSNVIGRRINDSGIVANRRAYYRLRVPKDRYSEFLEKVGTLGNIINNREGTENITARYFDNESRLKSLRIQEERLIEILKKADNVDDLIQLENALSNVRYQIESLTTQLREWDKLVNYVTIELNIHEVKKATIVKEQSVTFGEKIKNSFHKSIDALTEFLKGTVIFIIVLFPFVIVIGIIFVIMYIPIKKLRKKQKSNQKEKTEK